MTRERRTQEQRRVEAEQALIDAAAELIAEGGSAAVTLGKVGERAGFSRGLANHHFGSKANLMARVVEKVSDEFERKVASPVEASSAAEELRRLVQIYTGVVRNPGSANRARLVLIAEAITGGFEFRDVIINSDRQFRSSLREGFEKGVRSGEFPADLDASGMAAATIALLRGVAMQALTDPQLDLSSAWAEVERILQARLKLGVRSD